MKWRKKLGEPAAYGYLLPALIPLTLFWIAPMLYVVYLGFTDWDFMSPDKTWVGLDNYTELLQNEDFYKSLRVTLLFGLGTVVPVMAGGLALASLLQGKLRGKGIYQAIVFSPWITTTVAVSIVWSWIFEPRAGLANEVLRLLGLEGVEWLQSSVWALPAVIIVSVWQSIGWAMVFYLAALQQVPQDLKEAAAIDGAGRLRTFWNVTIPLISPTSFFLFIILWIQSFQAYDQISIMTQGGPAGSTRTLLYLYYQSAFERFDVGEASAVALVLVLLSAAFSLLSGWVSRRFVHYTN
ncbi:carbohydrate ABC transporter permease [Paenibacillus tarimensis]|uniref:carbohydrate ABC transporter permease n=1 Tax=Paenibacillus tarimensis TaxID=416012 RepID=UPI001F21B233|nr:sugar ABC transporter permease [Paenibacillus tarimensis]MCF2943071.1 sugar ABC transporter permease [Paenibacillus tarimensis]